VGSNVHSEEARDEDYYDHDADDVKNIHFMLPIEARATSYEGTRPLSATLGSKVSSDALRAGSLINKIRAHSQTRIGNLDISAGRRSVVAEYDGRARYAFVADHRDRDRHVIAEHDHCRLNSIREYHGGRIVVRRLSMG
jgi:hypothetical protein